MIKTCADCFYSELRTHHSWPDGFPSPSFVTVAHCNFTVQKHIDIVSGLSNLKTSQIPTCKASRESDVLCGEAGKNWVVR